MLAAVIGSYLSAHVQLEQLEPAQLSVVVAAAAVAVVVVVEAAAVGAATVALGASRPLLVQQLPAQSFSP